MLSIMSAFIGEFNILACPNCHCWKEDFFFCGAGLKFGLQAWDQAAKDGLGGWACIYNTVPYSAGAKLCIQFHHYRPKGYTFMACTHSMAQGYCAWSPRHLAQAGCSLSISHST